jgi:hypothetical protein
VRRDVLCCGRAAISLNFWLAAGLCYSHETRTVPLRPSEIHTLSSTAFERENQAQSMPAGWLQVQGLQAGQAGAVMFALAAVHWTARTSADAFRNFSRLFILPMTVQAGF